MQGFSNIRGYLWRRGIVVDKLDKFLTYGSMLNPMQPFSTLLKDAANPHKHLYRMECE